MPNNEFHTNHSLGQDDQTPDQAHFFPQGRGEALVRPGQEHFIAATDETGLGAVDAVADDSAPTSMWGEAWRDLRRRPLFWVSAVLIILALLLAAVPQLFTGPSGFGVHHRTWASGVDPKINEPFVRVKV